MTIVVWLLLQLDPTQAAHVAAWVYRVPVDELLRICRRESRCKRVGAHDTDIDLDGWGGQVRLGHLRPWCQPHGGRPYRWTTRGAWGLSAAAHWAYLPACYPAAILDVPLVSASVAARKWRRECAGSKRTAWCG